MKATPISACQRILDFYGEDYKGMPLAALLRTVKQAQRVGFTLAEIADLLRLSGGRGQGATTLGDRLRAKIAEIDGRIAALQAMRDALEAALHADCDSLTHCADPSCPFWTGAASAAGERPAG